MSGTFRFTRRGEVVGFAADRDDHRVEGATLERWRVEVDGDAYRTLDGVRVPTSAVVSRELDEPFPWHRRGLIRYEREPRGDGDEGAHVHSESDHTRRVTWHWRGSHAPIR